MPLKGIKKFFKFGLYVQNKKLPLPTSFLKIIMTPREPQCLTNSLNILLLDIDRFLLLEKNSFLFINLYFYLVLKFMQITMLKLVSYHFLNMRMEQRITVHL